MAVCKSVIVKEYEPSITATGIKVVYPGTNTEITTWREDEQVDIVVSLKNTGGDGSATVRIYYNNTEIDRFSTVVPGGGSVSVRSPSSYTIPAGSWNLCAEVVSQVPV